MKVSQKYLSNRIVERNSPYRFAEKQCKKRDAPEDKASSAAESPTLCISRFQAQYAARGFRVPAMFSNQLELRRGSVKSAAALVVRR